MTCMPLFSQRCACFHSDDSFAPTSRPCWGDTSSLKNFSSLQLLRQTTERYSAECQLSLSVFQYIFIDIWKAQMFAFDIPERLCTYFSGCYAEWKGMRQRKQTGGDSLTLCVKNVMNSSVMLLEIVCVCITIVSFDLISLSWNRF